MKIGEIEINKSYELPVADGTNGYTLSTDGAGNVSWVEPSGSAGGSSNQYDVAQDSHGLSVGNIVRIDSGGDHVKAQSDTYDNSQVVGIVSVVDDADNFTVLTSGRITGLTGLTAGTLYYLSSTVAGTLTTSLSPKPVLVADTTTSGIFINTRNYGVIVLDKLTADPVNPAIGQMWLRTDL